MGSKVKSALRSNLLTIATMAGVLLGVVLGVALRTRDTPWSQREAMYVSFLGKLFLQMLKCIIIPLIIPSLIASVGALDLSLSGRVGGRAIAYYMITTFFAVVLGIILVTTIRPGVVDEDEAESREAVDTTGAGRNVTTADTLMDLVRNCFPPNIIQATMQQYKTKLIYPGPGITVLPNNLTVDESDRFTWPFTGQWSNGTNILGLIVFSIATGIAIAMSGDEGKPLLNFFVSVAAVMMRLTGWIIYLAPVGVCFLIAGQILEMDSFAKTFKQLGFYFFTVVLGLVIHGFVVLPAIYSVVTRQLPFRFLLNMGSAMTTAFGTASSSATLPVTIDCLETKNDVDTRVARFVLPIGATINMDGTALYEAVAAIFIAQYRNVPMDLGSVIAISITATAASIGAAGIPQAGLVTMVMVLDTLGLPADNVAIILAVDWLLDRFRTTINVLGDSIGAGIVDHLSRDELQSLTHAKPEAAEPEVANGTGSSLKHLNGGSGKENAAYENTAM